jgi:hypothetical protein
VMRFHKTLQLTWEASQGSVLSPILFACFINDIEEVIRHCDIH